MLSKEISKKEALEVERYRLATYPPNNDTQVLKIFNFVRQYEHYTIDAIIPVGMGSKTIKRGFDDLKLHELAKLHSIELERWLFVVRYFEEKMLQLQSEYLEGLSKSAKQNTNNSPNR